MGIVPLGSLADAYFHEKGYNETGLEQTSVVAIVGRFALFPDNGSLSAKYQRGKEWCRIDLRSILVVEYPDLFSFRLGQGPQPVEQR